MQRFITTITVILLLLQVSCDDFVNIDPPRTDIVRTSVFSEGSTAEAAVVDLYISLRDGFGGGSESSVTAMTALSSDEWEWYGVSTSRLAFENNEIPESNPYIEAMWSSAYTVVYKANAVLEGLERSDIGEMLREQLRGEALFVRAFTYFYLVNLWGDVPLVTSTSHAVNNKLQRFPSAQVYDQIVQDLLEAQALLAEQPDAGKIRASRAAATTLLARVYLYLGDWENAEVEATRVIDSKLYSLETDLNRVFSISSSEAILQLWHISYPWEAVTFLIHPALDAPLYGSMRYTYLSSFEENDLRYANWINEYAAATTTFYGANKYKSFETPPQDYSTVLRLAELYLIRAEALAHQDDVPGSVEDLNIIRSRAGLSSTGVTTKEEILDAIFLERKHELFAEQGHRWLDLKRTGRADSVLAQLKPTWNEEDRLYPIPTSQIASNPDIIQNPTGL